MKLYTEEQVLNALALAHSHITSLQNIIERHLHHIELPSDEEINKRKGFEYPAKQQDAFEEGAKWMRDKIQGGNNEQQ